MGTFAAILCPYFKSCGGFEYGNRPIEMPFQTRNITEFTSSFDARSYIAFLNLHLVSEISFSYYF